MRSAGSTWAINIDKCESSSIVREWKSSVCIYKLPGRIVGENSKLYKPQFVPLGPYHSQMSLLSTELVKGNAAFRFVMGLKASSDEYRQVLIKLISSFTCRYAGDLDTKYNDKEWEIYFTNMMVGDGVFILEILRLGTSSSMDDRNPFYKLLTSHENTYVVPIIKRDMLLLENQVPFWFLEFLLFSADAEPEKIHAYRAGEQTGCSDRLLDLIIKCYSLPESTRRIKPPYLHILDVYRRGLISQDIVRDETKIKHDYIHEVTAQYFPSASKLYEAGIPFVKSQTANLLDFSYRRGILRLPPFVITKDTVSTLANLMAFEKLHLGAGNEVTSYVFVLNCLIHNARDVSLLESHGIIQHTLRDDEDVVNSLALIGKDIAYPPDNMLKEIQIVSQQLRARRFRKRLNIWRLDLLEKYLNTPWGALSVFGAILLFTLSIIQTVYSVLSYIHRNK